MKTVLAFDFGASSGRAIRGCYDGKSISMEEVHRFQNIPVERDGHMFHDIPMFLREIDKALDRAGKVDALAFDTWGVDYGLLNAQGELCALPRHYRDCRTNDILSHAFSCLSPEALYRATGNQIMPINTLFQLLTEENLNEAAQLLFMPDLLGYLLTGERVCEMSIASTSQMLDLEKGSWSDEVLAAFSVPKRLFAPLRQAPARLGTYRGVDVITVAGHDTQCAVAAMPCAEEHAAFLSCGTWSLLGCELDHPILGEGSHACALSNELGANGKINYLKYISGLWLLQRLRRELAADAQSYSFNALEALARKSEPFRSFVDPDDPGLAAPGRLQTQIAAYCKRTGQLPPETVGQTVRLIYESLVLKYCYALTQITRCTGKRFDVLHILGGGTRDALLCQMTADCLGIPVAAGPAEATALGNMVLQLIALGELQSVEQGRAMIARSEKVKMYLPRGVEGLEEAFARYATILKREMEES